MSEKHLLNETLKRYESMTPSIRTAKIRQLAKSKHNQKFIKKYFPNLFQETFPASSGEDGCSELTPHRELTAKHR